MSSIRVAIIEDDKIIHESLTMSINMHPAMELVLAATSVEYALKKIKEERLDQIHVLLLDIGLPGITGIEGIPYLKRDLPNMNIIMLTTYDETEMIFESLCAGACSYISKKTSLKTIMDSIVIVHHGGSFMSPSIARKIADHFAPKKSILHDQLTARQMDIVRALSKGHSYKKIAEDNFISINTVRSHIKKIYEVLEINSKVELLNKYKSDF
jgi:DNA-binding NarL/FixJ family response regulator